MIRIIRAAERDHWRNEWLDSRQSFPATGNFDLAANAHGVLMVHNDDRVQAGEGLDTHQHRDAEILTWVVDGTLRHRDSHGNTGTLAPGMVQRMTAGRGIRHAEGNASSRDEDQPLRVIQMWVAPEFSGLEPGYAEKISPLNSSSEHWS
ncbi:Putative quercetin 2,3-dioxygenase [Gordonia insulae]|uniref:Quercetin 2,3-dioxygenase n=1 Tax=Gordonia insulae TaxID=2420509 RepID=A0A3G8JLI2_9ACTN|nr:Putative quercetin 2,3-dioxygenase [Gordonia insulae]